MNSSKTPKKSINIENEFDLIFSSNNDAEDLLFEEMAINSSMMQVISELMKLNNIKSKAELAKRLDVSPAYITKLFSGDKTFNVPLLAKMQRVFNTRFIMNAKSLVALKDTSRIFSSSSYNISKIVIDGDYLDQNYLTKMPSIKTESNTENASYIAIGSEISVNV